MIALHFLPPAWWPLVLLLPLGLVLGAGWARRHERRTARLLGRREAVLLGGVRRTKVRAALAALAVLGCAVALLRPVAPGAANKLGPDVVLCVDVSRSMAARDAVPSRFAALQRQVHQLLDAAVGTRVAMCAFAGEVALVAPLTGDRQAVRWLVDGLAPGAVAGGGTDLGTAIAAAAGMLQRAGARGDIVLLTDGEDFGEEAAAAAAAARDAGHRVHGVGFGSAGGSKIVVALDGAEVFLRDAAGDEVVTRLDADGLARVAAQGGGAFVRGEADDALLALWRDDLVPNAIRQRLADGSADALPRFSWPLFASVLLWMLRLCLPERRP